MTYTNFIYAVYNSAAMSLSLGFDYTFDANNSGIWLEGFILPPPPLKSLKAKDTFNIARPETFYIRKECSDHYQHNLMASSENGFFRSDFIHLQLT